MRELGEHSWDEVFDTGDAHDKAYNSHKTLIGALNKHLQVKYVNMTCLESHGSILHSKLNIMTCKGSSSRMERSKETL